ncbi:uncharacterized protein Z518_01563 [Rhinocladiella mackenziei CBS 650.93]|uniref:Protein transport protein sec16 n=1 Tax=Rhinocladiella mackenziei CBS 650.93 TaxID=1442369 RepID=A0A0D2JLZ5_9EURO|nr:uncharacterized protein Z518_01563 [Rhinocladiella mackenziei CBS 650.93]KIX10480.1 hypothetical protein Z518_01563 [Rhinocladiella mackenziei CBS 650.93]
METASHMNNASSETSDAVRSGHWLPALRPDFLDKSRDDSHPAAMAESESRALGNGENHMGLPTSDSANNTTEGTSMKDTSATSAMQEDHISALKRNASDSADTGRQWPSQPADTTSRTDELPSDNDDERLDPAWGIKRLDSAHILAQVHRSTTFPEFSAPEPLNPPPNVDAPKREHDIQMANGTTESAAATEHESIAAEPKTLNWMDDDHDGTRDPPSWTIPEQADIIDDEAQRFDEGVPLIQAEGKVPQDHDDANVQSSVNPFETEPDDEETSFFSKMNGATGEGPESPSLGRKSTAQVLRSLDFSAKDAPESPAVTAPTEPSFYDELANAHVPDNEASKGPEKEDVDSMWAAALGDDEFLVEDADDLLPDSEPSSPSSFLASLKETSTLPDDKLDGSSTQVSSGTTSQQNQGQTQNTGNPYAPHQPSTSDMVQLSPTGLTTHNNVGISRPGLAPMSSFQAHIQQRPPPPQPVQSFVDQAKDGYKSPYDLPVDIAKPRKRAHVPQPVQTTKTVAPPPRSSSLSEKPLQSPFTPNVRPSSGSGLMPPPAPLPAIQSRSASAFAPATKADVPKFGSSSFFEELPVSSRPRPPPGHGRYTPQQTTVSPPQPLHLSPPSVTPSPPRERPSAPQASDPFAQYQLRAPERLDPYANVPLQPPPTVPAASTTRYSPAPATSTLGARTGPSPRYSPAPPPQPVSSDRYASQSTSPAGPSQATPPMPNRYAAQPPSNAPPAASILPFQPRTSSPLALHKSSIDKSASDVTLSMAQAPRTGAPPRQASSAGLVSSQSVITPEGQSFADPDIHTSPPKRPGTERLPGPRRSQTQSPSKQRPQPAFTTYPNDVMNRSTSVYGQPATNRNFSQLETVPPTRLNVHARGLAPELDFVRPVDDTQFDPLERWKGAPIFTFGFGGSILSTFPKHVPRYAAGAARPQIKSAAGEVSIRSVKDVLPQSETLNSFPGPLRSKSKKKEVLSWMSTYISELESYMPNAMPTQTLSDPGRRHHEKILLWRIVRCMVEHDGVIDGPALKAMNVILSPEIHALDESTATQYRVDEQFSGIYRPSGANAQPDSIDPMAIEMLRKRLLSGDRQAAVIHAMDNRLWSHALIISSTMDLPVWNQVVREFVRQEVKTVGANAEPLSALYEIFGGNLEESVDELVPPSARAGLQMVSKVDVGEPTKNALDGLNRWKETLSLVLNNRCQGDHQALAILGKLLEDYDRIEAAHICYLFSRNPARPIIFGGVDDEQTPIVLLGANHRSQPFDFGRDQEAILLTEIYEFASSILAAGSPIAYMPHLSVYKLQRATDLAERGLKLEAQSYCDAITATFKSSTKMSPYYHPLFLSGLDDLSNRLKQVPIQGSSSWIGKPSLEKVSGSMWTKFSSFVVGEDSDAESKASGKDVAEPVPFANVAGTPSISRSGSQSDLYGSYPQSAPVTVAGSRYAPNGVQSSRSSSELVRGQSSLDFQRSPPSTSYSQGSRQYGPVNMFQPGQVAPLPNPYRSFATPSPSTSYPQSPPRSTYMPKNAIQSTPPNTSPTNHETYAPSSSFGQPQQSDGGTPAQMPDSQSQEQSVAYGGYEPPRQDPTPPEQNDDRDVGYEPSSQSYGYEPPISTGYVPYVPEPESPEDGPNEEKPKKKSFIDDDDDDFPRTSSQAPPSESKRSVDEDEAARRRANDAVADAAFRAAAEADAARDKEKAQSKRSSSWFSGWLGGKKAADGLDAGSGKGSEPKVYRANLGESKMKLYYDKELGKWVNPDNPDAAKKTATPPPPRMGSTPAPQVSSGGPPRAPNSGPTSHPSLPNFSTGPPSAPSSRAGTPASGSGLPPVPSPLPGVSGPPSGSGTPPPAPTSAPGLVPPPGLVSRPGTAMSNSSSIDDLIGPATGRKGPKGGKKGAKSGRYVDVMTK